MRSGRCISDRIVRVQLALILGLTWCGALQAPAHALHQGHGEAGAGLPAAADEPDPAMLEKLAGVYERLGSMAREEMRRAGGAPWDWRGQAALLGNDPERIFEFVRDAIGFEPYEGVLRGSEGVMIARSGNALEQAQLLAAMLTAAGHETRLVSGALAQERAEALVEAFATRDPLMETVLSEHTPEALAHADEQKVREVLAQSGLPRETWQQWTTATEAQKQEIVEQLHVDWRREEAFVRSHLEKAGIKPGADAPAMRPVLVEQVAAGHVWVQRLDRNDGNWVDLDPSFGEAVAGEALASGAAEPFEVNDSMVHRLTFKLLMRRGSAAGSEDVPLLEVPMEASRGVGQVIRFSVFVDPSRLPAPSSLSEMPPLELREKLMEIDTFQAVLTIGRETHMSLMFNRKGETSEPSRSPVAGIGQAVQRIGGLFGALDGEPQEEAESQLQRLWVELEFDGPGGRQVQQRVLLDDEPLRKETLMTEWDLFLQSQPLSEDYLEYVSNRYVAAVAPILARMVRAQSDASIGDATDMQQYTLSPGLMFAIQRQAELARMLEGLSPPERPAVLWSRPNLFITKQNLRVKQEESWTCSSMDIVQNDLLLLDRQADLRPAAEMALSMGVMETCLEELVVEGCPRAGLREGTSSYFAHRRMEGREGASVIRTSAAEVERVAMPSYTRQWISQSVPEETVAIVPEGWTDAEGAFYYWSIDPLRGTTVGRSWDGSGQAAVEYTEILLMVSIGLCGVGAATGSGVVATACCLGLAWAGFFAVPARMVMLNSLIMSYSIHATVIPAIDPCSHLGDAAGF
jgi:hypothetical protein